MLEALHPLTSSCIKRVTIGLKKPYPHSQAISEKSNLLTRVFPFPHLQAPFIVLLNTGKASPRRKRQFLNVKSKYNFIDTFFSKNKGFY